MAATLGQLEDAQALLVQQERLAAIGSLAAGIAHDFNNILSVIVLNVELSLRNSQLSPKLHHQLTTISQQMQRATRLVQQILDFGRRGMLQLRPLDLVPFLQEQLELVQSTVPPDLAIQLHYGNDEYVVDADLTHMQQIFINLALNAVDAMPKGGELDISLARISIVDQDAAPLSGIEVGEWVLVTVGDNGAGIPEEALPHIFEPFFTTKPPGQGTGLGLAQVYGLVKQHQGHITVQTKTGEGTTFKIYLPAKVAYPPVENTAAPI